MDSFYRKLAELPAAPLLTFLALIGVVIMLKEIGARYKQ